MALDDITDSVFLASIVAIPLMLWIRGVPLGSWFEDPPAPTSPAKQRLYARFYRFQMALVILMAAALSASITGIRVLGERRDVFTIMLTLAFIWTRALFAATAAQKKSH